MKIENLTLDELTNILLEKEKEFEKATFFIKRKIKKDISKIKKYIEELKSITDLTDYQNLKLSVIDREIQNELFKIEKEFELKSIQKQIQIIEKYLSYNLDDKIKQILLDDIKILKRKINIYE